MVLILQALELRDEGKEYMGKGVLKVGVQNDFCVSFLCVPFL